MRNVVLRKNIKLNKGKKKESMGGLLDIKANIQKKGKGRNHEVSYHPNINIWCTKT